MSVTILLALALLVAGAVAFAEGRARALRVAVPGRSQPHYHGFFLLLVTVGPSTLLLIIYSLGAGVVADAIALNAVGAGGTGAAEGHPLSPAALIRAARNVMAGRETTDPLVQALAGRLSAVDAMGRAVLVAAVLAALTTGFLLGRGKIAASLPAREFVERFVRRALFACSVVAVFTTVGIIASLLFESLRFFSRVPLGEFLFGLHWSPQTALRADQFAGSGAFGAVPLFYGTAMVTVIAMLVAAPIGLMAAIYLSEYAGARARAIVKPGLEILAGVPTVVYGFFALLTVGPFIRSLAEAVGLNAPTQSALAAGLVMGVMIIPFVSSLSDDVINAVPQNLRDASLAMGATKSETVLQVTLPAALPGVMGAMLLAVSRAIGETMIVVMAAGRAANMPLSPLESVTTITVQIKELLTGDQEFDSAKTLSAFALGLVLFLITLAMNMIALHVVHKYRERYE